MRFYGFWEEVTFLGENVYERMQATEKLVTLYLCVVTKIITRARILIVGSGLPFILYPYRM